MRTLMDARESDGGENTQLNDSRVSPVCCSIKGKCKYQVPQMGELLKSLSSGSIIKWK